MATSNKAVRYCDKCQRVLREIEFYSSNNREKFPPDGRLNTCKKCITMHIDNWNPDTFIHILEDLDVPYIKVEWNRILEKAVQEGKPITGMSIIGKYLSKMKLNPWNQYRFADSEKVEKRQEEIYTNQLRAAGMSNEEIQEKISSKSDLEVPMPDWVTVPTTPEAETSSPFPEPFVDEELEQQVTPEERLQLKIKWGSNYNLPELVRLEQLYTDFEESYDIQGAGMVDTLIMICKASFRAN